MDTKIPVTQLLVGPAAQVSAAVFATLQTLFCTERKTVSCMCGACKRIQARQHHAVRWYAPEKQQYTLADIESLFDDLRFSLGENEHFVHIIESADLLSLVCGNSLLKSLEEPPRGYHFILTTHYPALVIPTLYSRCVVKTIEGDASAPSAQEFLHFFKKSSEMQLFECMKEFEKAKITERDTRPLIDELLRFWCDRYKVLCAQAHFEEASRALRCAELFEEALQVIPMAGSAKLFWRTVASRMLSLQYYCFLRELR